MIWVVSELYYPEETSTGHYMTQIAEGLALSHPVKVLCSYPNYSMKGRRVARKEVHNKVEIERCFSTTFDKNSYFLKALNIAILSAVVFFRLLLRLRRNDQVLVVTNPPLFPFICAIACRLKGARCVLRIDDVYPEAMIHAGLLMPGSFFVGLLDRLNRWLFRQMAHIVVLGRDMEGLVRRKLGSSSAQIHLIPNWSDIEEIIPTERAENPLLLQYKLADKFVVGYAGNIGPLQDIETLVRTASALADTRSIHFLIVGSGRKAEWLKSEIARLRLTNITLAGHRPRSEQTCFLNACDLALVSLVAGMSGVGVPSRAYNIIAAGKPIVASVDSQTESALLVKEEGIGWVVPAGQPEQLASAIREASANPELIKVMGKRARAVAESKYARSCIFKAYRRLFSDCQRS